MLYIKLVKSGYEFGWHTGEKKPPIPENVQDEQFVVQADCDELEYIINTFSNIPYSKKKRVQVWRGEYARFIAENL